MSDPPAVVAPLPDYANMASTPGVTTPAAPTSVTSRGRCAACGQSAPPLALDSAGATPVGAVVYAVGRLSARFPSLGVEREYAQLAGADPDAVVHTADLKEVLADAEHRYLAWQMCWVFSGPAADVCVVVPRGDRDLDELIDTLSDSEDAVQLLVGSPAAWAPSACATTALPAVVPDQLLSFTLEEFLDALPTDDGAPEGNERDEWRSASRKLFEHLTQRSENRGVADEHRAMNYVALRYPPVYHLIHEAAREGRVLIGVDATSVAVGDRRAVDLRFVLRHTGTHVVERFRCRVDTTDVFPFLLSSLTLTYD